MAFDSTSLSNAHPGAPGNGDGETVVAASAASMAAEHGVTSRSARVLLVDDDEDEFVIARDLLRLGARTAGALRVQLDWVADSQSAVRALEGGAYDAALIDFRLGRESGLDLIARLQDLGCAAPLILMTGQDDPRVDAGAMGAGATDYLVKDGLSAALLERTLRYAIVGKAQERELRRVAAQNAQLLAAIENTDVGVALTSTAPGTPITYVNPAFSRITGHAAAEVAGRSMSLLRGPQTAPEAVTELRAALQQGRACQVTSLNYRRDGSTFWNEVHFAPIWGETDEITGYVGLLHDVSERLQAQSQAREARANLETAQALTHLGSWSYKFAAPGELEGKSGFWSDETYRILGLEPGAVDPSTLEWIDFVHPDDREAVRARREARRTRDTPALYECRLLRPDGEVRHVQIRARTERDEAGLALTSVGTLLDVTERVRARRAEQELEGRLASVTENVPIILWAIDQNGVFTLSQGRTLENLGLQPGEAVGQSVFDVYRDNPQVVAMCRRALAGQECEEIMEVAGRTFAVCVAPQRNSDGEQTGVVGISYDITDQSQAQQALRESEARFERIVSNMPGMVYRVMRDENGADRFLYVSQGCHDLLGIAPEMAMRDSSAILSALAPEDREPFQTSLMESARDLTPWRLEFTMTRADGERRRLRAQSRAWRDEAGRVIWDGIMLDLTENQRAQEALQQSRRSLAEAQRLAKLGSFSWNVRSGELQWSDEMYRLFGLRRDEFVPSIDSITERIHHSDREQAVKVMRAILDGNVETQGVRLITRADGALRYLETRSHVERDANGEIILVVGSAQDVTEQIEAQRALRESEERYALAARGTNDGLWDWNLENGAIYFSPRWKAMIGHADAEIGARPDEWFGRVHAEDIGRLHAVLNAHFKGGSPHFECEYRLRNANGDYIWMLGRGLALFNGERVATRLTGSQTDISDRKRAEGQLERNAYYDGLTGLPNRALFSERLDRTIARGNRHPDLTFAVLFLDIDHFKKINDSLGHLPGDRLLIEAARRFETCLRPGDTVARLGGDEFAVLLDDLAGIEDVQPVAERIQAELKQPFSLDGHEAFITVSMGIALGRGGELDGQELLRSADTAMYRAKSAGRGRHQVFEAGMHQRAVKLLELETDLWRALERQELRLHFQPIIALSSGEISGFEALVRWQHPERGLVSPGDFIPLAEETGLIIPIGWWVLEAACRQAQTWRARFGPLWMSVNLSSRQLTQLDMMERVSAALQNSEFDPHLLKLEITESAIMENTDAAAAMLQRVKDLGVQFSMDDFGTGYSSLSYLHRFPLDTIKVDRSFVSQMTPHARNREIVQTIVSMAHGLTMQVVAEGVENAEQLQGLREMECGFAQGFYISRPLPADQIESLLERKLSW